MAWSASRAIRPKGQRSGRSPVNVPTVVVALVLGLPGSPGGLSKARRRFDGRHRWIVFDALEAEGLRAKAAATGEFLMAAVREQQGEITLLKRDVAEIKDMMQQLLNK